jgi:hypothetical protein
MILAALPFISARASRHSPAQAKSWCRVPSRYLVAGSGLRFGDRGDKSLKGVPGKWHIFAVKH